MIQGHFHGNGAGHALNNKILHALFQDPKAWKIVEKHEEDMILPTSKRFSAIIGQGQQAIA
jgi:UDP-3-O-acyl-N-acetylglucosamine deacetylase